MGGQIRWKKQYPDLAKIAIELLDQGYTQVRVQEWLESEGHKVSTTSISLLRETSEEREARLDRHNRQNRKHRATQRASGRIVSGGFRKNSDPMLNTWLNNSDFNPKT